MKEILTIILCVVLFVVIVLAILFHEYIRKFRIMLKQAAEAREARRQAEADAYFKRTSTKNYREEEKTQFTNDYFKSSEETEPKRKHEAEKQQQKEARRTVQTGNGVTIIDDRQEQQTDRKIFDDAVGEYVEFEEV